MNILKYINGNSLNSNSNSNDNGLYSDDDDGVFTLKFH